MSFSDFDLKVDYVVDARCKTIQIVVDVFNKIKVKMPNRRYMRQAQEYFWESREEIISTLHLKSLRQRMHQFKLSFEDGDFLPLFEEDRWLLKCIQGEKNSYKMSEYDNTLTITFTDESYINKTLKKYYMSFGKVYFQYLCALHAKNMGLKFNRISIKDSKTRWGSCSGKKNLNFNFRLLFAPEHICLYVVIHELAHLAIMNHSKEFWDLVGMYYPNYKEAQQWLKENGLMLHAYLC